jgi:hypothetical protein
MWLVLPMLAAACAAKPDMAAASHPPASDLTPIVSVKELMQNIVDPQADWVFNAVGADISEAGTIETKPTTDEDWEKVQRGALTLAEATNLIKMPRRVAPVDDKPETSERGAPELTPAQIQVKIDADRGLWNRRADELRDQAVKVLAMVKARDSSQLLQAGSDIDRACENCHLDYWYPGDRAAVLKDQNSRAFTLPVKK